MSASSRTVQATPNMGQLAIVFAALLAGTALIVALAYGQLTASQVSVAPAAAPAPASTWDHGWSSSPEGMAPAVDFTVRDSGWMDTTPIRPVVRDSGWMDTTPIHPSKRITFEQRHHGITEGERFKFDARSYRAPIAK